MALIDAGAPWDMQERHVLMGQDIAPVLKGWSGRQSTGSDGFTLTLELAGRVKPLEFFVPSREAVDLAVYIAALSDRG